MSCKAEMFNSVSWKCIKKKQNKRLVGFSQPTQVYVPFVAGSGQVWFNKTGNGLTCPRAKITVIWNAHSVHSALILNLSNPILPRQLQHIPECDWKVALRMSSLLGTVGAIYLWPFKRELEILGRFGPVSPQGRIVNIVFAVYNTNGKSGLCILYVSLKTRPFPTQIFPTQIYNKLATSKTVFKLLSFS